MRRGYVAIAFALGALTGACGGGDQQGNQPRQPNNSQTLTPMITPQPDTTPPPRDMPGGGRGSEPPHFKGKP